MDNVIALAYLGDAVFELFVREFLLKKTNKVNDLQKLSVSYVSAVSQSKLLKKLFDDNILNADEVDIVLRGRNNKRSFHPKNTDIITYKHATGFESLIGYLYLNNKERLDFIVSYLLKEE